MFTTTRPALHLIAILAAALSLSACAPQPRKSVFNEAAFTHSGSSGSGTIAGTAFTIMADGNHMRAANSNAVIKLMPANDYTEEIVTRHYYNREKLEPADPRLAKYVRKMHPDDSGHFAFNHVPAGNYYVSCNISWNYNSPYTDNDGVTWDNEVSTDQWIYSKVSLGQGQTARVENWVQGK